MGETSTQVRVLVVDDHAVVRSGMRLFFDAVDDIEVVAEAANGQTALDLLERMSVTGGLPDVAVVDLVMPVLDGTATIDRVSQRFPAVRILALTSFGQAERVQAAMAAGAAGYLLKDAEPDELAAAVRAVHRGEVYLDSAVTRGFIRSVAQPQPADAALTRRERDVLVLVAKGKSNREIARALAVSERTVRTHVSHLLSKLGLSSRTQAALWAIREGLVSLP